jgi:hypothetical protein
MTTTNRLILFREVITVYCENHIKQTHSVGRMLNVKAGGICSYCCDLQRKYWSALEEIQTNDSYTSSENTWRPFYLNLLLACRY